MIFWIMFGAVAGAVASLLDEYPTEGGMLRSVALGILGSSVGGILANMLFGINLSTFSATGFILAIAISIIALLIHHTVFAKTNRI